MALVAFLHLARETRGGEKVHVFSFPSVGNKGDDAPIGVIRESKPRFFPYLPGDAVFGAFAFLKLAADADPFIVIGVVLLFHPVQHQILAVPLQIAKSGMQHGFSPPIR